MFPPLLRDMMVMREIQGFHNVGADPEGQPHPWPHPHIYFFGWGGVVMRENTLTVLYTGFVMGRLWVPLVYFLVEILSILMGLYAICGKCRETKFIGCSAHVQQLPAANLYRKSYT